MKTLELVIVTPDQKVFSGSITGIRLPGALGSFEVLPQHADIDSTLEKGILRIQTTDGKTLQYSTHGGVIEVKGNNVSVLLEEAAVV